MVRTYHPTIRLHAGDALMLDGETLVLAERDGDRLRVVGDDLRTRWLHIDDVSEAARRGTFALMPEKYPPSRARAMAGGDD